MTAFTFYLMIVGFMGTGFVYALLTIREALSGIAG